MNCDKCPIREECGVNEEQAKSGTVFCPLVALMREWRTRMLKKISRNPKKYLWGKALA